MIIFCCIASIVAAAIGVWALRGEKDAVKRAKQEKRNRKEDWVHGSTVSDDVEMS